MVAPVNAFVLTFFIGAIILKNSKIIKLNRT